VSAHADRFCAYCGGPLIEAVRDERPRRVCSRCDRVAYRHPAVGAIAAVLRGGEVLLIKRSIEPFRGHWTLPAGYLEAGEEPWEAARRETREETGLEIERVALLDVLLNRDDHRSTGVVIAYLARAVGGALVAGDDAEDARFFSMGSLPAELGFANNRLLLDALGARLRSGELR
jgi:ADP-ribose pyrophosphatase YjhB (NUDIX family)